MQKLSIILSKNDQSSVLMFNLFLTDFKISELKTQVNVSSFSGEMF